MDNEQLLLEKFEQEMWERKRCEMQSEGGELEMAQMPWKERMKFGLEIQKGWMNLEKATSLEDSVLFEDVQTIQKEVYENLKEYFALPKLRKENCHVESELNTILQTYLYDFLYDQQDLYEYYDEFFYNKKYQKSSILVKNQELPLASSLENFPEVFRELCADQDKVTLGKLRWYIFHEEEPSLNLDIMNSSPCKETLPEIHIRESILLVDEKNVYTKSGLLESTLFPGKDGQNCFSLPQTDTYNTTSEINISSKLISKLQNQTNSRLIFILNCLNLTVTHFCQVSYGYIMKYFNNDTLFLNEYTKRYKSFVDSATYLNDYLENLNVLVNYSYEILHENLPCFPKFSVLRLMILTWNRKVLNKINSPSNNCYPICEKVINLYSSYLTKELNKINLTNSIFSLNESLFSQKLKNSHNLNCMDINFDDEDNISMMSESTNYSVRNSAGNSVNSKTYGNGSNIKCSKLTKADEDDDDFMNVSMIGQMCSLLTDTFTNEYSVFNFNHSSISTSDTFKEIEDGFSFSVEKAIRSSFNEKKAVYGTSIAYRYLKDILAFFKGSEVHNKKLINKMKLIILTKVIDTLINICYSEIKMILHEEYILGKKHHNNLTQKDVTDYFKIFGDTPDEKHKEVFNYLLYNIKNNDYCKNLERPIVSYHILYFIKDYVKVSGNLLTTLEEIMNWSKEIDESSKIKNKQVEKEIKRRNITTFFSDYQGILLSMTKNVTWKEIINYVDDLPLNENDDSLMLEKISPDDVPTTLGLSLDL